MLENKKRQEFNERLRARYNANNQLFDIAEIESTLPDGSREKFILDGEEYYSLYSEYTNDGGHLNKEGQLRVAQAFLYFLGEL
jgi:lysophospholipase L1-like esterase